MKNIFQLLKSMYFVSWSTKKPMLAKLQRFYLFEPLSALPFKMVTHTLKSLQHLMNDFRSVSDHFETISIKVVKGTTQFMCQ